MLSVSTSLSHRSSCNKKLPSEWQVTIIEAAPLLACWLTTTAVTSSIQEWLWRRTRSEFFLEFLPFSRYPFWLASSRWASHRMILSLWWYKLNPRPLGSASCSNPGRVEKQTYESLDQRDESALLDQCHVVTQLCEALGHGRKSVAI